MNCASCQRWLGDLLDRTLSAERAQDVRFHLSTCSACAQKLQEIETDIGLVSNLRPIRARPELVGLVMARVAAEQSRASRRWAQGLGQVSLALAGAVALGAALLTILDWVYVFLSGDLGSLFARWADEWTPALLVDTLLADPASVVASLLDTASQASSEAEDLLVLAAAVTLLAFAAALSELLALGHRGAWRRETSRNLLEAKP